jgi:hypothetical protein
MTVFLLVSGAFAGGLFLGALLCANDVRVNRNRTQEATEKAKQYRRRCEKLKIENNNLIRENIRILKTTGGVVEK